MEKVEEVFTETEKKPPTETRIILPTAIRVVVTPATPEPKVKEIEFFSNLTTKNGRSGSGGSSRSGSCSDKKNETNSQVPSAKTSLETEKKRFDPTKIPAFGLLCAVLSV